MRLRSIGRLVVLASALALASATSARAQYPGLWPTYGAYTMPGMYGFGFPGAAIGYGGWGYPGFGYGGYGFGGFGGFGGYGVGGFGYGGLGFGTAIGYPPVAPFGFQQAWMGGYYPGFGPYGGGYGMWNNPATLALGITPLAIQAGLMERGLSTAMPTRTVMTPVATASAARAPAAARASAPSATVPLTPGTYRITVERIDPTGAATNPTPDDKKN